MGKFLSDIQGEIVDSLQGQLISFIMGVQDTFTLVDKATVATGEIGFGYIKVGEEVEVITRDGSRFMLKVTGIERNRKLVDIASKGDAVGILFPVRQKGILNAGDLLIKIDKP